MRDAIGRCMTICSMVARSALLKSLTGFSGTCDTVGLLTNSSRVKMAFSASNSLSESYIVEPESQREPERERERGLSDDDDDDDDVVVYHTNDSCITCNCCLRVCSNSSARASKALKRCNSDSVETSSCSASTTGVASTGSAREPGNNVNCMPVI
jgi:NAD-dependent dihydropyrimidine dehydrogenase PreA subunit